MLTVEQVLELQNGIVVLSDELQKIRATVYEKELLDNKEIPKYFNFLYLLTKTVKPKVVVELGTCDGLAMLHMIEGYPDADFYTIDINPNAGKFLEGKKVTIIIGDSANCANQIPNNIDILFEDTDHQYNTLEREFKAYYPKMAKDGILIFDDMTCPLCPGATAWWKDLWWNKIFTPNKFSLPLLHPPYGMTAIIRNKRYE